MLLPVKVFKIFIVKFPVAVGLSTGNDMLIYALKGLV